MVARCLEGGCLLALFEECGPVWRMRMEEPAAPRRFPPVSFSLFFPQLFLYSFVGVLVMLALSLSFGTRVPFWRMASMATPSGGMWNQTFSVAGLNATVSQDGLRCTSTRTASVLLWPRTAENAGAATSELFISTCSTDGRLDYPSSLRGSGHLRLVSFDTEGAT